MADKNIITLSRPGIPDKNIYYYRTKDRLFYGSDLKKLTRQIPEIRPDPIGIFSFIAFGYLPFEYTPIENLHKVLPGQTVTWGEKEGVKSDIGWKYPDEQLATDDENFYTHNLTALLEESLRKSVAGKDPDTLTVLLSGGVDSSFLCTLSKSRQNTPPFRAGMNGEGVQGGP